MNKYSITATICVVFILATAMTKPVFAFLGFAALLVVAVGYAASRNGVQG